MRILQSGIAKSGNYWVYKLLTEVLRETGAPERRFIKSHPMYDEYRTWPNLSFPEQPDVDFVEVSDRGVFYSIPDVFMRRVDDLDRYVEQTSYAWTHSPFSDAWSPVLYGKFDKIIYIVRDPRDAMVSLSHFAFAPYASHYAFELNGADPKEYLDRNLPSMMRRWVAHVTGHLKRVEELGIHVVFYERLRQSFDVELDALLAYLQISLDPHQIQRVKEAVGYGAMKTASPNHVRSGLCYTWVRELSDAQEREARRIAGPLLRLLGYPVARSEVVAPSGPPLPELPRDIDRRSLDELAAKANRRSLQEIAGVVYDLARGEASP